MKIDVVTTFNQSGFDLYGKAFLKSFQDHWPEDIDLHIYNEGGAGGIKVGENVYIHSYEEMCPDGVAFKEKPKPTAPQTNVNRYRFLADKFSHKIFALAAHMRQTEADFVLLIDADTETTEDVTAEWVAGLMPSDAHVACLLRPWYHHTECGFVLYRVCPKVKDFVETLEEVYKTGHVFTLDGWCDSSVFDYVRERFQEERGLVVRNLTNPDSGEVLDVFAGSVLSQKMLHKKGARKHDGSA